MQDLFNMGKSINHMNRMNIGEKPHDHLNKCSNPTTFTDKNSTNRKRKGIPQQDKDIYKKQTANSYLMVKE